jgi:hypothetical protein
VLASLQTVMSGQTARSYSWMSPLTMSRHTTASAVGVTRRGIGCASCNPRAVLAIAVADEEPEGSTFIFYIGGAVSGDLVTQRLFGLAVGPRTCTTRRSSSITNNT